MKFSKYSYCLILIILFCMLNAQICNTLPNNYSDFEYCQESYEREYFIGFAKITDTKEIARNHALLDLSSSIATSILSDMDLAMKEQTVVTVGENGEQNEEYQLEDFFAYNL